MLPLSLKEISPSQEELRGKIRILTLARPLIITVILGTGIIILSPERALFSLSSLYKLLLVTYFLTGLYWLAFKLGFSLIPFLYLQMTGDVILETFLVHFSGGIESQLSLFYFLSIITASIFLLLPGSLYVSTLSSIAYASLIWLEYQGMTSLSLPLTSLGEEVSPIIGNLLFWRVYLHILLFYLVAFLSGYIAEVGQAKGRELARTKLDTDDVLKNMGSGLITIDAQGRIVFFNRMAEEILECSAEEVKGRLASEAFREDLKEFGGRLSEFLQKGITFKREQMIITRSDGTKIPVGISSTLLFDETGKRRGSIIIFQDLTEVKRMEEKLRQIDRLAAIGELSAGIAHEIRNPLASIKGSAEMLQNEKELSRENQRLMQLIVKEADRLNRIVEDFLLYARSQTPKISRVRLDQTIEEVLKLVRNHFRYTPQVRINTELGKIPLYIEADEEQLKQVFLNLTINSLEAIKGEGEINIKIEAPQGDGRIPVIFEDNGEGISEDQIDKIFQPFYTTRKGGSGLGLAIVHRIIESHQGEIEVQSKLGKGTKFTVWLKPRGKD